MYKFRPKTDPAQHLEISFEFYTTEKSEYRKPEYKSRPISQEPGFRNIPFQSNYALQLNYMQRPRKNSLIRSWLSLHI